MAILGIDLGTTNSACCLWSQDQVVSIPNRLGDLLTPSVVGIDESGAVNVGKVARERLITHPDEIVAIFKRLMGTEHKVTIGKRSFSATELSSLIIQSLKEDAEAHTGQRFSEAVISVPAYFNENQRYATKLAGELAGLKVKRLINEPTAAAIAYGLNDKQEGTFLILDMGGGTFDVSILEYFDGVMEVHASAGDNYLGGEDFVEAMIKSVLADLSIDEKTLNKQERQQLYLKMEHLKRNLESDYQQAITLRLNQQTHSFTPTADWFERVINPILLRVKAPIQRAMQDADLHTSDIDDVILVGGATKLKHFRAMIAKLFGRFPSCNLDPDLVVAIGTGIQAALLEKNQALDDVVLTDVCPYSLGTEVSDENGIPGCFMPIIERNTVVPVSIERSVVTASDYQTELAIKIYQGESRLVKNNVFLGELKVKVPKDKKGEQIAHIRYSYDNNGLLEVDVTIGSTGKTYNKLIENAPGMLSAKEIEKTKGKLSKLKVHPRDTEKTRALLARADRVYASYLGEKREYIASVISQFEKVLDNQNLQEVNKAQAQLEQILDEVDNQEW